MDAAMENFVSYTEEWQRKSERDVRRALENITITEERKNQSERDVRRAIIWMEEKQIESERDVRRAIARMEETDLSREVIGVFCVVFVSVIRL